MQNKFVNPCSFWLMLIAIVMAFQGCSQPPEEPVVIKKEEPAAPSLPPQPSPIPDPQQIAKLPAPKPAEVKNVVTRVFKDAVTLDANRNPCFVVGDFNGDYAQDIAVVIKPVAGKLSELNQEYPPWMLKDPFQPNQPPQMRQVALQVELQDVLLAVIHGYGPDGWRNPEATQTYLLKGAVGNTLNRQSAKDSIAVNQGKKLPKIFGDTIAQAVKGSAGFLYYTGATYAWYDPKTYQPGAERAVSHMGMTAKK
jgi:hypothetical protein